MSEQDKSVLEELKDYDPYVRKLVEDRYWHGIRLFDSRTHRLKSHVRDRAQARKVLMLVEKLGAFHKRKARLNKDEQKCLDGLFPEA